MEAKAKALKLVEKFFHVILKNQQYLKNKAARKQAKQCALICVAEIQKDFAESCKEEDIIYEDTNHSSYYTKVKKQIELLCKH